MNIQNIQERFWSRVDVTWPNKCWNWKASCNEDGYGSFNIEGQTVRAPRVAFFLRNGKWPNHACHKCDVPACCNPSHIYDGTAKTNAQDRERRGRRIPTKGELDGRAILTAAQVLAIRYEYKNTDISMSLLGKKYGCSLTNIQHIISRTSWTHI